MVQGSSLRYCAVRGLLGSALALLLAAGVAGAAELQPGLNAAGVIAFPTALDQPVNHSIQGTIAVFDLAEPDVRAQNLRYGFQWGNAQFIGDADFLTQPEKKFDHGEVKAKLRLATFDKFASSIALGILGRFSDSKEGDARFDNKPLSFLGIFTAELFPFDTWGGFLVNLYLDNRYVSAGLKFQIIDRLQFISETSYLHSTDIRKRGSTSVGIEIDGEQNFYFQLFYNDPAEKVSMQLGTGF